ncbi:Dos2-interacting transcription regulator of RNA-Pol-II-domain-containing protein [Phlyctochytrium arcticum]|nr:Dos2-interacting transcription regulator of RNA-Pol-II-domain-containing protein [Phlyctochytrium arcticum]
MSWQVDLETYANAPVESAESLRAVGQIVLAVNAGQVTALKLVESLGPQLTHNDPFMRAKGIGLLSSVLAEAEGAKLGPNIGNVLIKFYLSRLQDQPSVGELLKGLQAMVNGGMISDEDAAQIPVRIFAELAVQTYQQTTRYIVYGIFDLLLQKHMSAMKSLGSDFVSGFVQAMDGEKDPRNLLLAFRIIKTIVQNLEFAQLAEDVFSVVFCYFPITFRPPPDDVYGITSDDLKAALRDCISATPLFATYAMPLLMEKLASVSGSAKRDALDTLTACAPVYGPEAFGLHGEHLWNYLKEEVFRTADDANIAAALKTVGAVAATLSQATVTSGAKRSPLEGFLELAVKDSMDHFKDPELKYAKLSGKLLVAAAAASDPACHHIVNAIFPPILEFCGGSNLPTQQKTMIEILVDFIRAARLVYGTVEVDMSVDDDDLLSPIVPFKDNLFALFGAAAAAKAEYMPLRRAGVRGLLELHMSSRLLSSEEADMSLHQMNASLLHDADSEVRAEALAALQEISRTDPGKILQNTFVQLFQALKVGSGPSSSTTTPTKTPTIELLSDVEKLSSDPQLARSGLQQLLERLDSLNSADSTAEDALYAQQIAKSMVRILQSQGTAPNTSATYLAGGVVDAIILPLLATTVKSSMSATSGLFTSEALLRVIAQVFATATRMADVGTQQRLVAPFYDLFVNRKTEIVGVNDNQQSFSPLEPAAPASKTNISLLFAAVLCNAKPSVVLAINELPVFLRELVTRAASSVNPCLTEALAKSAASITNKLGSDGDITTYIQDLVIPVVKAGVLEPSRPYEARRNLLVVYSWHAKALVLRAHPLGYDMTADVLQLLRDATLGQDAAQGMGVIVKEADDGSFTKQAGGVVKLLYKQRLFGFCLPRIVQGFQDGDAGAKQNYLISLSYLLKHVSKQLLPGALEQLFPLLLSSLSAKPSAPTPTNSTTTSSSAASDTKLATLETLTAILEDDTPEVQRLLAAQSNAIVEVLVTIGISGAPAVSTSLLPPPSSNSDAMETETQLLADPAPVRVVALKVLGQLSKRISYTVLHPLKPSVVSRLARALDDPKRIVRREAANTRNKWFLALGPRN